MAAILNINAPANSPAAVADRIFAGSGQKGNTFVERLIDSTLARKADQKFGPAKGTSMIAGSVAGNKIVITLPKSTIQGLSGSPAFDGTERSFQVSFPKGVGLYIGHATTALVVMHEKYMLVAYVREDKPAEHTVVAYKTEGTVALTGEKNKRFVLGEKTFVSYLAKVAENAISYGFVNRNGYFLGITPYGMDGFGIRLDDKLGEDQELNFAADGSFGLTGTGAKLSGAYTKVANSVDKKFGDSATASVYERSPSDNIGPVMGTRSMGVENGGVITFTEAEMTRFFGIGTFEGSETILPITSTESSNIFVIVTRKGPSAIEIPKKGSKARAFDLGGGANESSYEEKKSEDEFKFNPVYIANSNMYAWITKTGNEKMHRLNVFFPKNKEIVRFDLETPGKLTTPTPSSLAVDGTVLFYILPSGSVVDSKILVIPGDIGFAPRQPNHTGEIAEYLGQDGPGTDGIVNVNAKLAFEKPKNSILSENSLARSHLPGRVYFARRHI